MFTKSARYTTDDSVIPSDTRDQEAMETIQQWIYDLQGMPKLTTGSPKAALIELLTKHRPIRLNVLLETYSFSNALAVLTLSTLNIPTKDNFITILTNALRVYQNGYACQFILSAISNIDACYTQPEKRLNCTTLVPRKSLQDQRSIDAALEQANRMQAELWMVYPKEPEIMSPTSSTITASSSFSSMDCSTTATSITPGNDESNFFDFVMNDMPEWPMDADYNDVMQSRLDFSVIKSKIQTMLDHHKLDSSYQLNNALQSLVENCNHMQDCLFTFESGFAFTQLCNFTTACIDESQNYLESLSKSTVITRADLKTWEHWVSNNLHLANTLLSVFKHDEAYKPRVKALIQHCAELKEGYLNAYTVWSNINDIKDTIQEGIDMLNSLNLTDESLSQHSEETSIYISVVLDKVYNITRHNLQTLVNKLSGGMDSRSDDYLDAYEKVKNTMVHSAFLLLQKFKRDMLDSAFVLEKFSSKRKLEQEVERAILWLQNFRGNLFAFSLIDCLWCPFTNATIRVEGLVEFKQRYAEFTLTHYNNICSYFPEYTGKSDYYMRRRILFKSNELNYQQLGDTHLKDEYKWFQDVQELCDQISDILEFASRIQQQQADIIRFIQHADQFTERLLRASSEQYKALQKEASQIYKDEFSNIQWPTCLDYGQIGRIFYKYSQSLYLKVSDIKINFMATCQNM